MTSRNIPKVIIGPEKVQCMGKIYPLIVEGKEVETDYLKKIFEAKDTYIKDIERADRRLAESYEEINRWYEKKLQELYDK